MNRMDKIGIAAGVVIALVFAVGIANSEVPEPIRDTSYDWRCVDANDVVVSNHTRQDKAMVACQNQALAHPGETYYIQAGRYRVKWKDSPIDPPPIDPPPIDPPPIDPPPEQDPVAMYSYSLTPSGELLAPMTLEGTTLERKPVFMAMSGGWAGATYYCCKSTIEAHKPGVSDNAWPIVLYADMSAYADTDSQRELYVDLFREDGTTRQNNFANFYIEAAPEPPPIDPPIDPPVVYPDGVTMHWTIPDEREDGTPLAVTELSHYVIAYWKDMGDVKYVDVDPGSISNFDIDLPNGDWTFQIKAVDNTPDVACPDFGEPPVIPEDHEPYSCGGPLESQWSGQVTVNIAEAL
jgi:hypothetical protein